MDEKLSIEEAHKLADDVEKAIKTSISNISEILIHVEPAKKVIYRIAVPIEYSGGEARISEHFGRAKSLMIVEVNMKESTYKLCEIVDNPFATEKDKAGIKTVRMLVIKNIDAIITRNIGDTAYFLLKGHGIKIYQADTPMVDDVVEKFIRGTCKELKAPTRKHNLK